MDGARHDQNHARQAYTQRPDPAAWEVERYNGQVSVFGPSLPPQWTRPPKHLRETWQCACGSQISVYLPKKKEHLHIDKEGLGDVAVALEPEVDFHDAPYCGQDDGWMLVDEPGSPTIKVPKSVDKLKAALSKKATKARPEDGSITWEVVQTPSRTEVHEFCVRDSAFEGMMGSSFLRHVKETEQWGLFLALAMSTKARVSQKVCVLDDSGNEVGSMTSLILPRSFADQPATFGEVVAAQRAQTGFSECLLHHLGCQLRGTDGEMLDNYATLRVSEGLQDEVPVERRKRSWKRLLLHGSAALARMASGIV